MSLGFNVAESMKVVNVIPATDGNLAHCTGDYINMENAAHLDLVLSFGITAGTATIVCLESSNATGGSAATRRTAAVYGASVDSSDVLSARATLPLTGKLVADTNYGIYVVSIDADELSDGYPYVTVQVRNGAANAFSCVGILSGCRYATDASPTVLT